MTEPSSHDEPTPILFRLLLAAAAGYLLLRAVQAVVWLVERL